MELKAKFTADDRQFNSVIDRMERRVNKATGTTVMRGKGGGGRGIGGGGGGFGGIGTGLAAGLGWAAVARAVVSFGKDALKTADELMNLQDATGLTVRNLQAIRIVGEDAGVSFDKLEGVLHRVSAAQQEALSDENSGAADQFRRIGIEVERLRDMDPSQVLEAVGRAASEGAKDADKMSGVIDLIGVRSKRALEVLKQFGSQGFDALADKADAAGQVVSENAVQALESWEKTISAQVRTDRALGQSAIAGAAQALGLAPETFTSENVRLSRMASDARTERMARLRAMGLESPAAADTTETFAQRKINDKLRFDAARQAMEAGNVSDALLRVGGFTGGRDVTAETVTTLHSIDRGIQALVVKDTAPKMR